MAVYKVPQDVEAEDKFLGPLTFRQFLFFGGTAIFGWLTFITITKGAAILSPLFGLPAIAFGILAFPWTKDQPSELWLAAHIRFMFIRRKRIWDQSGMKELVKITAPKHQVHSFTDGLSPDEVRSRFNALASVVDSRGWAVKNLSSISTRSNLDTSDRLVSVPTNQQDENAVLVDNTIDVMDESANPLARQFDNMIEQSNTKHRRDTLGMIEEARRMSEQGPATQQQNFSIPLPQPKSTSNNQSNQTTADDLWFLNQNSKGDPTVASFKSPPLVAPAKQTPPSQPMSTTPPDTGITSTDEQNLLQKVHKQQQQDAEFFGHSHLKTIQPIGQNTSDDQPTSVQATTAQTPSAPPVNPAILNLARNDDLTVDTIARQVDRDKPDEDEVVIQLH